MCMLEICFKIRIFLQDKELQQIFQGQSAIREVLTELHRRMDDIVARQERSLQVLGAIQVSKFNQSLF